MRRISISCLLALTIISCSQNSADFFKPYQETDLRMPSVPLIVNDPYLSIWSPYDKLTDGATKHWTDDDKPLTGMLRVDGTAYRFMGAAQKYLLSPIAPMADYEPWEGKVSYSQPSGLWMQETYDDTSWKTEKACWGNAGQDYVKNVWQALDSDIWVRREINVSSSDLEADLCIKYSWDDLLDLYVNGTKVIDITEETYDYDVILEVDENIKKLLHEGRNVIAAHCHNTSGGAYLDFGLFKNIRPKDQDIKLAEQTDVDVLSTSTFYTFKCGPVDLDVVFTAPMLIDDLDMISTPVNYISYRVSANDGKTHDVQFFVSANPLQAVDKTMEPTITVKGSQDGISYARCGTIEQPILAKKGDGVCCNWGYFYMPEINGQVTVGNQFDVESSFVSNGNAGESENGTVIARNPLEMPIMAYVHDFGSVSSSESFMMLGYDEIEDIEYMYNRYKGYWAHNGKVTIFDAFKKLGDNYADIMSRCQNQDKMIYEDGFKSGGKKYAEILSGCYRHVMAAHKLFEDKDGNLLYFSKENNSNGCVNTVDLTYPECPLFLCYNPSLQKAMMRSILEYSKSGRWTKPFAAHDLGTYPIANGQVYGGDMPLEEAGNMITLSAQLCKLDGNTDFVDPYWDVITVWADYLAENGLHPENQLCTDDFAGHWAGNCNLALKAIMGVEGYAEMAKMKHLDDAYAKYHAKAKEMASAWENETKVDDHYELAYGSGKETWSQKYNMVWDNLWASGIIPNNAMQTEISYYLGKQNKYGLPLDCRKDYTKTDWIMWTASMSPDKDTFCKFVDPVYDYINETQSRVPTSDWSDTKTGLMVGFKARSVIGGYWMRVFADKLKSK